VAASVAAAMQAGDYSMGLWVQRKEQDRWCGGLDAADANAHSTLLFSSPAGHAPHDGIAFAVVAQLQTQQFGTDS
jgi:hypothetical protein